MVGPTLLLPPVQRTAPRVLMDIVYAPGFSVEFPYTVVTLCISFPIAAITSYHEHSNLTQIFILVLWVRCWDWLAWFLCFGFYKVGLKVLADWTLTWRLWAESTFKLMQVVCRIHLRFWDWCPCYLVGWQLVVNLSLKSLLTSFLHLRASSDAVNPSLGISLISFLPHLFLSSSATALWLQLERLLCI